MTLTDREKKIIAFALNYMASNLDDIDDMLSEDDEEYKPEYTEQEVFDLYGKFSNQRN